MRHEHEAGFTLIELLLVVVTIMLLSLLAYPSLKSFNASNADTDVASAIANTINKVRDQARRRNRAYAVTLRDFNGATPNGRMVIREGSSSSCRETFADLAANSREIERIPYGQAVEEDYPGKTVLFVGASGWAAPNGSVANPTRTPFELCASPDGALLRVANGVPVALTGRYQVVVQRFIAQEDGWAREGPLRTVELTFNSGARLGIN